MQTIFIGNIDELNQALTKEQIILRNPPFSIYYLGLPYLQALLKHAQKFNYNIKFECDIECEAGLAQEALRMGFKHIVFKGEKIIFHKLVEIAGKYNAEVILEKFLI
jgi:hypothetical protein